MNNAPQFIKDHIEKFGKEPETIGMFWDDFEAFEEGVKKAIEDDKPYNEYEMLSEEEKRLYDNEELFF